MLEAAQTFSRGRGRGQKGSQGLGGRGRGRGKEFSGGDRGGRKGNRGKVSGIENKGNGNGNESDSIFFNEGYEDFDSETDREKEKANGSRAVRFAENSDGHARLAALKEAREGERADLIRRGIIDDPNNPKPLSEALTFIGTCMDMCPLFEREERQYQKNVDKLEVDPITGLIDPKKAVKSFHRPAAGNEAALPSDVRPPAVLVKTLDYLIDEIVGTHSSLMSSHSFVRDRTRGIRQDFTLQNYWGKETIECSERIARYHILCIHQLAQDDRFVLQQELEQLKKTMTTLNELYDDAAKDGIYCPNEPEFRAYYLVLFLHVEDIQRRIPKRPFFDSSRQIQVALKLHYSAFTNAPKLFKQISSSDVTYLMACVANVHFFDIRRAHLKKAILGYNKDATTLTVDEVARQLGFDSKSQAVQLCEYLGMETARNAEGEEYIVIKRTWDGSQPPMKPLFNKRIVEMKRKNATWKDIINGVQTRTPRRGPFEEEPDGGGEIGEALGSPSLKELTTARKSLIWTTVDQPRDMESVESIPSWEAEYSNTGDSTTASPTPDLQSQNHFYQSNNDASSTSIFATVSDSQSSVPHRKQHLSPFSNFGISQPQTDETIANTAAQLKSVFAAFASKERNVPAAFAVGSSNATFNNMDTVFGAPSRSNAGSPFATQSTPVSPEPSAFATHDSAVPFSSVSADSSIFAMPRPQLCGSITKRIEKVQGGLEEQNGEVEARIARGEPTKIVLEKHQAQKTQAEAFPSQVAYKHGAYSALNSTPPGFQPVSLPAANALFTSKPEGQGIPDDERSTWRQDDTPTAFYGHEVAGIRAGMGVFNSEITQKALEVEKFVLKSAADQRRNQETGAVRVKSQSQSQAEAELPQPEPQELLREFSIYVDTKMRDLVRSPNLKVRALVLSELKEGLAQAMEVGVAVNELPNVVADAILRTRLSHGAVLVWRAVKKARARAAWIAKLNKEKRKSLNQKEKGVAEQKPEQWVPVKMKMRPGMDITKEATLFRESNYDMAPLADILTNPIDEFLRRRGFQNTVWSVYVLQDDKKVEYWWLRKFGISGPGLTRKSIERTLSFGNTFRVERVLSESGPPADAGVLIFGCRASFEINNLERFELDKKGLHRVVEYALRNNQFGVLAVMVICYRSPLDETDANPLGESDPRTSKEGRSVRLNAIYNALDISSLPGRVIGRQILLVETLQDLNFVPAIRSLAKAIETHTVGKFKSGEKGIASEAVNTGAEKYKMNGSSRRTSNVSTPSSKLVMNINAAKRGLPEQKVHGVIHRPFSESVKVGPRKRDLKERLPSRVAVDGSKKNRQFSVPKAGMKTDYFALRSRGVILDPESYPTAVDLTLAQKRDQTDLPLLTRQKSPELADYEEDEVVYTSVVTRKRSRDLGNEDHYGRAGMSPSKRRLSASSSPDIQHRPMANAYWPYDFDNDPVILEARKIMSTPHYHPEQEYPELQAFDSDASWAD